MLSVCTVPVMWEVLGSNPKSFFLTVAGGVVSSVRAMDLGYGAPVYLRDFRPQLPGFPLTCEVRGSSLSVVRCLSVPHQSFVYVMLA